VAKKTITKFTKHRESGRFTKGGEKSAIKKLIS